MKNKPQSLVQLAKFLDATVHGDVDTVVTSIAPLHLAKAGQLSFLDNRRYKKSLAQTQASIVILAPENVSACPTNALVMDNPYIGYAKASVLFDHTPQEHSGIHPTAIIADDAMIADTVRIGPHCVVESGVMLEDNVQLGANCVIGERSKIKANTRLWANVTVYHGSLIGERALIHSGVVIGSDGFGMAKDKGVWHKIFQLGNVVIGNDVEIGANTTIDRGALEDTTIADGVKLDNQIQIAHNVKIGKNTAIAACTGISGSTVIGEDCIIGGGTGISGHIEIADNVAVTGMSMVTRSLLKEDVYSSGTGLLNNKVWRKSVIRFRQLDEMAKKLKQLERLLDVNAKGTGSQA